MSGGFSTAPSQTFTLYALLGFETLIHTSKFSDSAIGNTLEVGLLATPAWTKLRSYLKAYAFHDYNQNKLWTSVSLQTQYALSSQWEVGVQGEYILNTPYHLENKSNQVLAMIIRHF